MDVTDASLEVAASNDALRVAQDRERLARDDLRAAEHRLRLAEADTFAAMQTLDRAVSREVQEGHTTRELSR